jgi:hypothetical protein
MLRDTFGRSFTCKTASWLYEQIPGIVAPWSVERGELTLPGAKCMFTWSIPNIRRSYALGAQRHVPCTITALTAPGVYLGLPPVNERGELFVIDSGIGDFKAEIDESSLA